MDTFERHKLLSAAIHYFSSAISFIVYDFIFLLSNFYSFIILLLRLFSKFDVVSEAVNSEFC